MKLHMRFYFIQFCATVAICCTNRGAALPTKSMHFHDGYLAGITEVVNNRTLTSVGPFELYNADTSSQIRFQFAGQLRVDFESRDQGVDMSRTEQLLMKARRIRPTMTVNLLKPDLSFRLHLSTAPKSLELMDFYFNYAVTRHLQLRCGQYKVPFTRYRIQSFQQLTFVDWAIVTEAFGAERQMGFALHNGYEKPPQWGYALGVFTGVNARASHAVSLPKVYAEETTNPSDLANPASQTKFHPELFLHVSRNGTNIRVQSDTDEEREGFRYSAGVNAAWDLDPTVYQDLTVRLAPELLTKYQGLSVFTAGYAGFAEIGDPANTNLVMVGGLFQTAYRINDRYEISARYAVVDFKDAVINDAYDRAQRLIAEAEDNLNNSTEKELAQQYLSHVMASYEDAGQILREQEVRLGFNIYIISHFLKWQNDLGRLRHTRRDGARTDYVARCQFQLTF